MELEMDKRSFGTTRQSLFNGLRPGKRRFGDMLIIRFPYQRRRSHFIARLEEKRDCKF